MQLHEYQKSKRKGRKPESFSKYNLYYKDIAKAFGYNSAKSFRSSSALSDMLKGIDYIIKQVEDKINKV